MSDKKGDHDFSEDELDDFEESMDDRKPKPNFGGKNPTTYVNKPYDEAIEVSQDLSMAESYDLREKMLNNQTREKQLKNDRYDEAVEVSQSLDQVNLAAVMKQANAGTRNDMKGTDAKGINNAVSNDSKTEAKQLTKGNEQTRSQSVLNKPFDEALEFSHSGSEESIDTAREKRIAAAAAAQQQQQQQGRPNVPSQPSAKSNNPQSQKPQQAAPTSTFSSQQNSRKQPVIEDSPKKSENDSEEEDEDGHEEHEESYDHIEGSYNPKDYQNLNVPAEVRDLFQYIERYKPQEVELDTPLRCFIPEYIPAIGDLDPFIKIPRPDKRDDGSGLKYLDEPATNQSDPTVLELQLRAKSKKIQYGDVAVRSIENADKNPQKIEKWIQDINELHRSKPPPQVNYKKNMPDIDSLMEAWPEEFEQLLGTTPLPSPDLELSLTEYAKVLCTILDIPVYDNPVESLHLMFSLYLEFKNNPHFQSRLAADPNNPDAKNPNDPYRAGSKYGGADVLEIENDYK